MNQNQPPSLSETPSNIAHWEFNNIQMGYTLSTFDQTHTTFSASNSKEAVRLHFGLKGDYAFTHQQLHQSFDLLGGHHNIMYSQGLDIEVRNKTLQIETFGVDFPKEVFLSLTQDDDDFLKQFTEDMLEGRSTLLSENWGTVDVSIQKVIDEIRQNAYTGRLQEIFLLAKSLELLVLCIDNYRQANVPPTYLKNRTDREKVVAARDYLNGRISNPPNLSNIAKAVGMNECKLKRGFKEMFHSTVFGYLTERRLQLAMQYLRDTQRTAAEIAYELGYSSPQHFSHQFRKKFGLTPNSVRKNP
ncbi:MAG: AraC family transcriptional regulator [Cyclobacteriaceae bacterium]